MREERLLWTPSDAPDRPATYYVLIVLYRYLYLVLIILNRYLSTYYRYFYYHDLDKLQK